MGLASIVKLVEIFTIEMEESSKTENEAVQVVYVSKNTTPANIEETKDGWIFEMEDRREQFWSVQDASYMDPTVGSQTTFEYFLLF